MKIFKVAVDSNHPALDELFVNSAVVDRAFSYFGAVYDVTVVEESK